MSPGFTLFLEMPASAVDDALIPAKKAFFALRFRNCLAQLKWLCVARVLNHLLGLFTKCVADVILLQIGLKCFSMRITLDLLDEFANTEVICLFHNCMWESKHLKSMSTSSSCVNKPVGCPLTRGLSSSISICIYVFVLVFVFLAVTRETWINFLSTRTGRFLAQRVSPFYHDLDKGLVGLFG